MSSLLPGTIDVSPKVRELILAAGEDFRVSTTCFGPALHPLRLKPPKDTDIVIPIGGHRLYVSGVQARLVRRIDDGIMVVNDGR